MSVFVRRSLSKSVNSFQIFKIAKECLKWYLENISDVMPINKIDHVFVPDLKSIAMENVGCFTYDDKFLDSSQSANDNAYFHMIIAHEL
jgi:aminopeptidase N